MLVSGSDIVSLDDLSVLFDIVIAHRFEAEEKLAFIVLGCSLFWKTSEVDIVLKFNISYLV